MSSRLAVIAIDCHDARIMSDFWCSALGWRVRDVDGPDIGIGPDDPGTPGIDLLAFPEAKTVKNRIHLDLRADDTTPPADEVRRLIDLGARHVDVGQPDDASWVTLADPEGNEFCVLGINRGDLA
ncbi:VOC family protein [Williamsia sp. SKLECPSW1]